MKKYYKPDIMVFVLTPTNIMATSETPSSIVEKVGGSQLSKQNNIWEFYEDDESDL